MSEIEMLGAEPNYNCRIRRNSYEGILILIDDLEAMSPERKSNPSHARELQRLKDEKLRIEAEAETAKHRQCLGKTARQPYVAVAEVGDADTVKGRVVEGEII